MKIAEVSKLLDISADTLRYYERIGLIPKIHRQKWKQRLYRIKLQMDKIHKMYEKCGDAYRNTYRICNTFTRR